VITEPEMWEEPRPGRPADVLSDDNHSPRSPRRRPWLWALGGVVAASALWAAVLRGTGDGRAPASDLHGMHLGPSPCTALNLEPLTDSVSTGRMESLDPEVRTGPALDHASCFTISSIPGDNGWAVTYGVVVTVDLHKKADPRGEFVDTYHPRTLSQSPHDVYVSDTPFYPVPEVRTRPYPDLGDLAFLTGGVNHQTLGVLYGGAALSLSLYVVDVWGGLGEMPKDADGTPSFPPVVDSTALIPVMARTLDHLMRVLAR